MQEKNSSEYFLLNEQLARDTIALGTFPLCLVLLMNDCQYPWVILVPRRTRIREIYELTQLDQQQLLLESASLGRLMMETFAGEKLNVAALGNVVSQLHIHHLVRYHNDPAWPRPVWGIFPPVRYSANELLVQKKKIVKKLCSSEISFKP